MRSGTDVERSGMLVALQHLRRAEAQIVLNAARLASARAEAHAQAARDAAAMAHADWATLLARRGFSPEHAHQLADAVGVRERAMREATDRRTHVDSVQNHCEEDWRRADAASRSTEAVLARIRRDELLRREERRLAETADRTTAKWRAG